jgi:hypothetical protein
LPGHVPIPATDVEIGEAEAYKTAIIFSYAPGGGAAAPPWLVNFNANVVQIQLDIAQTQMQGDIAQIQGNMAQIQGDVALLQQKAEEQPILRVNRDTVDAQNWLLFRLLL